MGSWFETEGEDLVPIAALFLAGLLTTGAVYLVFRSLGKQASLSIGKERDVIREEITKYDDAIARAIEALSEMVSLDEQSALEVEREKLKKSIEQENAKVKKLEGELESLQQRVDKQEITHNELKKGKEDSDKLAANLRESKERVQSEATELSGALQETLTSFTTATRSGKYDQAQVTELANIQNSIELMTGSLKEFSEFYTRGATRFVNLEKQYEELEREFRRLVDKALSGEEIEDEDGAVGD